MLFSLVSSDHINRYSVSSEDRSRWLVYRFVDFAQTADLPSDGAHPMTTASKATRALFSFSDAKQYYVWLSLVNVIISACTI